MKFNAVGDLGEVLVLALSGASLHEGPIRFADAPVPPPASDAEPVQDCVTELDI